jgi:hypothetical protein
MVKDKMLSFCTIYGIPIDSGTAFSLAGMSLKRSRDQSSAAVSASEAFSVVDPK